MPPKSVYLLEHFQASQPTLVGVFTSRRRAEAFLKTLPKSYAYAIYQIPVNENLAEGDNLADQQGVYEHWHYGTNEVAHWEIDDDGNVIEHFEGLEVRWPGEAPERIAPDETTGGPE